MAAAVGNGCADIGKNFKINGTSFIQSKERDIFKTEITHKTNGTIKNKLTNGVIKPQNGYVSTENNGIQKSTDWLLDDSESSFEKCSLTTAVLTHIGLYILMFLGFVNQLFFTPKVAKEKNREGYATLYDKFEQFFSHYVYRRVRHCFNRPVTSSPAAEITVKEWVTDDYNWTFRETGKLLQCINLGSYNYLGFAESSGPCADAVEQTARQYGLAMCSPVAELGRSPVLADLEETTAKFLGVEAAIVFGMGFATNSLGLPGLLSEGDLVLSDENNHASLIIGLRLAKVKVRVFRHNDLRHLEELIKKAIKEGHWKKIVVVVEGVYSMEGSIVPLRGIVSLKRRYGVYIYLDEAHSIGALGATGRGVSEHWGLWGAQGSQGSRGTQANVDVLMGTFTKSFGGAGGYIAGSAKLIECIRYLGHAHTYAQSMSPVVAQQVLSAMKAIDSPDGVRRIQQLKDNTRHFRKRLRAMGVITFGSAESPVVPMLVYTFSKMSATVEALTARGVAVVGVGFPATPLNKARIRFCLSAAHTREQLDKSLDAIEEVVNELGLRYSREHPYRPIAQHTDKSKTRTH